MKLKFLKIYRATINDIKAMDFVEGGSTITQQLAKNIYFTQDKKFERKIAEVFMAFKIESKCEKDEILEELGYGDWTLPQIDLLLVQDRKPIHKTLNFGAMSIMESMADMLERRLYGKSRAEEYVQYNICEKLWNYVVKKDVPSDIIFRCCEFSLMDYNPGQLYFAALRIFAAQDVITKDTIDDFFTNWIKPSYKKKHEDMFSEMMGQFSELVPKKN